MAIPAEILEAMKDIGFMTNMLPLNEIASAARLRTILTSRVLHDARDEYDRTKTSDDAISSAASTYLGALEWHRTGSITHLLRQEYTQHSGYGYIPLSPDPPGTCDLPLPLRRSPDDRYDRALWVL